MIRPDKNIADGLVAMFWLAIIGLISICAIILATLVWIGMHVSIIWS